MKTRKFAEGGRFSEKDPDIYARARRWQESQESDDKKEEDKTAVKKERKVEVKPAKEKSRAPAQPAKAEEKSERAGPTVQRAEKQAADKDKLEAEYAEKTRPGRDAIENVYPEALLLGGAGARGLMGRKGATASAERRLATREDPLTFLGRSGPKNITPTERLAGRQAPRLEFGAAKIGRDGEGVGRLAQGAPKPAAPSQITSSKAGGKNLTDEVLDILRGNNPAKKKATSFKEDEVGIEFKRGGKVKKYAKGGSIDGIAQRGKTNCKMR